MTRSEFSFGEKERVPIHASVGILIGGSGYPFRMAEGFFSQLLLARQKGSQQWGPVAGKLGWGETLRQAAWRELAEETNLTQKEIVLHPGHRLQLTPIIRPQGASLGFIFEGHLRKDLPPEGYVPESKETDLVRQFSIQELVDLLHEPESIYRPDFNLGLIDGWIWSYLSQKYAFEGPRFCEAVACSWGLDEIGLRRSVSVVL